MDTVEHWAYYPQQERFPVCQLPLPPRALCGTHALYRTPAPAFSAPFPSPPLTIVATFVAGTYVFCFLIFKVFRWVPVDSTILPSTIRRIQMLSLLFTLNICAGNMSLMYTTVSLREVLLPSSPKPPNRRGVGPLPFPSTQVVRSLTPGITLCFSVWLLKKSFPMEAVWYAPPALSHRHVPR